MGRFAITFIFNNGNLAAEFESSSALLKEPFWVQDGYDGTSQAYPNNSNLKYQRQILKLQLTILRHQSSNFNLCNTA